MTYLRLRIWIAALSISRAASFVQHISRSPTAHHSTALHGLFGGKKEADEDKEPKEVYASRVTADNSVSDDNIIDVKAAKLVQPFAETTDYDVIVVGA